MEYQEQPGHNSLHMREWQVEFRVLATLHALPLRIVWAQRQLPLDRGG